MAPTRKNHDMTEQTIPPSAPPEMFNLVEYCLSQNTLTRGDKTALTIVGEQETTCYTFSQANHIVMSLSGVMRQYGQAGDRVLLRLPNTAMFAFGFLAAAASGMIAIPASPQLTTDELAFLLEDTQARLLCTTQHMSLPTSLPEDCHTLDLSQWPEQAELYPPAEIVKTMASQPAYMVYTSGTTGQPKGVLHAHRSVWGRRPMRDGWTDLREDDVMLHAGQLNWTYTMGVGLLDPWSVGASSILYNGPKDPKVWPHLIQQHNVTMFAAVPSVYRQLLKYNESLQESLASLRHGLTAGEALSPTLLSTWKERTGTMLYEALGMSECSTYISSSPSIPVRPGSPGRPQRGRTITILPQEGGTTPLPQGEIGCLAIHRTDPGLMVGYWKRPEEEKLVFRGEWFVGGDLAHLDEDGYIWFHGRNDELMNAFGYRVSPREVEKALETHPDVREVAVTEIHVGEDVSVITAFIVPHGDTHLERIVLQEWAQKTLATYKCPREYVFVMSLPRTTSGKVKRRTLQTLWDAS